MNNLTLNDRFHKITHLTWDIESIINSTHDIEQQKTLLKKIAWYIPDGSARDNNAELTHRDATFVDDIAELLHVNMDDVFTDFNHDGVINGYDAITAYDNKITQPDNEIWYNTVIEEESETQSLYDFSAMIRAIEQEKIKYNGPKVTQNYFDDNIGMFRLVFDRPINIIGGIDFDGHSVLGPFFITNSNYGLTCNITSIILPSSVETIGDYSFAWTETLATIKIPDNVKTIGSAAFVNCAGITTITIPNNVTMIGDEAFAWCSNLTSINLGNNVNIISGSAFYSCVSLETITLPNSVTEIGEYCFSTCSSLSSITLSENLTDIGNSAFSWCENLVSINIPDSVINLGDAIFFDCVNLKYATIGNNVSSIPDRTFQSCVALESIDIPDSVTSIGNYAFSECTGLTSAIIGNGVTIMNERAFFECASLESVIIGTGVTNINNYAFYWCDSLTYMEYKGTVEEWGEIKLSDYWYWGETEVVHCSNGVVNLF